MILLIAFPDSGHASAQIVSGLSNRTQIGITFLRFYATVVSTLIVA